MRKLISLCLLVLSGYFAWSQEELPSIYNPEKPYVVNIWNRVADYSPTLRSVESAEISNDGKYVVSGAKFGYSVMLWRVTDGSLIWEKAHDSEVECVVFSTDGHLIATGGEDFYLRIWDRETGNEVHQIEHPSALDGISWSNEGNIIATGTEDGELFLWDAQTYQLKGKVKVGSTINSIQFTQNDQKVAVGGNIKYDDPNTGQRITDGFAKLLDVNSLKTLVEYEGPEGSVKSIRLSPDEKYVATGGFDHTARLFELPTGKLLHEFKEPSRIEAVAFSQDGQFLLTGGHDHMIRFYKTTNYEEVYTITTPRTEYIDFSRDGRLFITAHEDSGLLSLYLMVSETGRIPGLYNKLSNMQLKNRDMQ
ncbi:MAG: WD40 repeat domain-containing protein [Candidatus Cyclobacteriaceae bacterium M3_2C_046]